MDIKQLDAASAYGKALKNFDQPGLEAGDGKTDGLASGFASMVEGVVGDVAKASSAAEISGAQVLSGQADLVDVVTAANNAQMTVETVVMVRDKVIAAYNDILKMPI